MASRTSTRSTTLTFFYFWMVKIMFLFVSPCNKDFGHKMVCKHDSQVKYLFRAHKRQINITGVNSLTLMFIKTGSVWFTIIIVITTLSFTTLRVVCFFLKKKDSSPFQTKCHNFLWKKNTDSLVINIFHDTQYSELLNNIPDKHVAVDFPVTVE